MTQSRPRLPSVQVHDVLVGIDYSAVAARTLKAALEVASRRSGSRVHVLAVAEGEGGQIPDDLAHDAQETFFEAARATLQQFVDETLQDHTTPIKRHNIRLTVQLGDPAERIVEFAKEVSANIVVVGSHGKGRLESALMGSVTDSVLQNAPCSVLVVHASDDQAS